MFRPGRTSQFLVCVAFGKSRQGTSFKIPRKARDGGASGSLQVSVRFGLGFERSLGAGSLGVSRQTEAARLFPWCLMLCSLMFFGMFSVGVDRSTKPNNCPVRLWIRAPGTYVSEWDTGAPVAEDCLPHSVEELSDMLASAGPDGVSTGMPLQRMKRWLCLVRTICVCVKLGKLLPQILVFWKSKQRRDDPKNTTACMKNINIVVPKVNEFWALPGLVSAPPSR